MKKNHWLLLFALPFILLQAVYAEKAMNYDIQIISKENAYLSQKDLKYFQRLFALLSFIETGTYSGGTTEIAAAVFPNVYSIEIHPPFYEAAKKKLERYRNIHLFLGDTNELLSHMIHLSGPKRIYWLDAHYCGENTGGIPGFNPVPKELQIIKQYGSIEDVILIDDMRGMFHCDSRTTLPTLQVYELIKEIDPNYEIYSIGDIAIAYNKIAYPHVTVSPLVKACSVSRFYDQRNESLSQLEELIASEVIIGCADPFTNEGKRLLSLGHWANNGDGIGGEVIYVFWRGLNHLYNNQIAKSIADLTVVTEKTFYRHWRVYLYLCKALILNGEIDKAKKLFATHLQDYRERYPTIFDSILGNEWINLL